MRNDSNVEFATCKWRRAKLVDVDICSQCGWRINVDRVHGDQVWRPEIDRGQTVNEVSEASRDDNRQIALSD